MKLHTRTETIREVPSGWLNLTTGRTHKNAALAAKAVKRRSKEISKSPAFEGSACIINWEPTTELGALIVKTVAEG